MTDFFLPQQPITQLEAERWNCWRLDGRGSIFCQLGLGTALCLTAQHALSSWIRGQVANVQIMLVTMKCSIGNITNSFVGSKLFSWLLSTCPTGGVSKPQRQNPPWTKLRIQMRKKMPSPNQDRKVPARFHSRIACVFCWKMDIWVPKSATISMPRAASPRSTRIIWSRVRTRRVSGRRWLLGVFLLAQLTNCLILRFYQMQSGPT